jgi:hypothetical protein
MTLLMSNTLELNCWVLGNDPRRVFAIDITCSKTVGLLKEAIKEKKKHTFDGIDADSLNFWKVSNATLSIRRIHRDDFVGGYQPPNELGSTQVDQSDTDIPEGEELKPWDSLSSIFKDGVERGYLHIIVGRSACTHNPFFDLRLKSLGSSGCRWA